MITIAQVQMAAFDMFRTSAAEVISPARTRPVVHYRQVAIAACARLTVETFASIGAMFQRDHTSVSHSVAVVEADPRLRAMREALCEKLRAEATDWTILIPFTSRRKHEATAAGSPLQPGGLAHERPHDANSDVPRQGQPDGSTGPDNRQADEGKAQERSGVSLPRVRRVARRAAGGASGPEKAMLNAHVPPIRERALTDKGRAVLHAVAHLERSLGVPTINAIATQSKVGGYREALDVLTVLDNARLITMRTSLGHHTTASPTEAGWALVGGRPMWHRGQAA